VCIVTGRDILVNFLIRTDSNNSFYATDYVKCFVVLADIMYT